MIKSFRLALLFFLVFSNGLSAQIASPDLDSVVTRAINAFDVAGAAVGIVQNGCVLFEKGFGLRSSDSGLTVNEHTNFQIASNSKAFTTAALAMLVDEGKLSWKDKVKTFIPEFTLYNKYVTDNFLVEDLLTHRSGLGLGAGDLMIFPDGSDFTIKDILTNLQYFKPVSAFRTQYDYDNQLYLVAGELVSRVSGMNWDKFVQNRILDPLMMLRSFTSVATATGRGNVALPHLSQKDKWQSLSLFPDQINGAAGGIFSNVHDLCKWMLLQLNAGQYGFTNGRQLFTENRQQEMWTIHTVTPADKAYSSPRYHSHFSGYGLGWQLSDLNGNMRVSHGGVLPGMISSITMIPDLKLGIVILTNTEPGGEYVCKSITQMILDSYLGLSPVDWLKIYTEESKEVLGSGDSVTGHVWKTVAEQKNMPVRMENFVGTYEDRWFGKVEISVKEGQLWFRSIRSPKLNGALQSYQNNCFAIQWKQFRNWNPDALVIFIPDKNGKAKSIQMKGISPYIDFSYDFQDLDLRRIQ